MKVKNILTLSLALYFSCFYLLGCVGNPKYKDFDSTKKIQSIEVMRDSYIYAQDDILLKTTFEKELAKMDKNWEQSINKYNTNNTISGIGFTTQIVTLLGCLLVDDSATAMSLCGASILSGWLVAIPFQRKAAKHKHKVVNEYNARF